MTGGQDWAAGILNNEEEIAGESKYVFLRWRWDMSDKKSCRSRMSDNDLILVRWQDETDGGWREGVVMCLTAGDYDQDDDCCVHDTRLMQLIVGRALAMKAALEHFWLGAGQCIIYDHHRNERAIVPLSKVRLVPQRCSICNGDGEYERMSEGRVELVPCKCVEARQ